MRANEYTHYYYHIIMDIIIFLTVYNIVIIISPMLYDPSTVHTWRLERLIAYNSVGDRTIRSANVNYFGYIIFFYVWENKSESYCSQEMGILGARNFAFWYKYNDRVKVFIIFVFVHHYYHRLLPLRTCKYKFIL